MSVNPRFRITNAMRSALTRVERARGFIEGARLSDDWVASMQAWARIVEAHHSTQLAGLTITLDQADRILAGVVPEGVGVGDVGTLRAARDALDTVGRTQGGAFDEERVLDLHRRIMGIRPSGDPGARGYRKVGDEVVDRVSGQVILAPPPPSEIPRLVADLMAWIETDHGSDDPLVAGIVQLLILQIRPFEDGNGRTARLLSLDFLHRSGYGLKGLYSLSEPYDRDRPGYVRAIRSSDRGGDLTGWLEYFCEKLAAQMHEVQDRAERVVRREEIARSHPLSQRQRTVLAHALLHGGVTVDECEKLCPGVSRSTLLKDLRGMVDRGLLCIAISKGVRSYRLIRSAV